MSKKYFSSKSDRTQCTSLNNSGGMLAWLYLGQGGDLHMAQLMPLPLTISGFSKSGQEVDQTKLGDCEKRLSGT